MPLKAAHAAELGSLEKALSVERPLTGFLVIEPSASIQALSRSVGCLAMIRQVGRDNHGRLLSVIARGQQRVDIHANLMFFDQATRTPLRLTRIKVLPRESVPHVPQEIREGCGHWAAWVVHRLDPHSLAALAYDEASKILPDVKDLRDDPCLFSYWLAASLPICCASRQNLLTEDNVSYRLRKELQLIASVSGIFCESCSKRLANVTDVITMSEMGPNDVFVNANGYVHDLITVRGVHDVKLYGSPQKEFSWFDGYAWTIAHCAYCLNHIGWRFTAVDADLHPHCFWGLSRARITHEGNA